MLNGSSGQGRARRSIRIGSIAFDGRDVPIRLERIKPEDGDPVWLFSAQTVDNIDRLYAAKGPSWLARQAPEWSRTRLLGNVPLWQWLALAVLLGLSVLTAWLVIKVLSQQLASHLGRRGRRFVENIRWPAAILTTALVGYSSVGSLLTLPGGVATVASPLVLAVMIFSATWLCVRVLGFFSESVTQNMLQDGPSIDESGTLVRLTVFRYVLVLLIVAIGLSVLLISIDMFRTVGIALLGSAGAAAVVLGIAGHAVLGNLIAGVQIALARPFRIGDTVIVEGYWGRIEEVRYTYVAVRTWDQKRVILPVRYFLNHYFENWSKTDPFLVKPIYLKVDYRADVQAIREKFMEIVRQDEDWAEDRDDPDVLVIECGDETITIRLTCGGSDSPSAWRLVCRVREKLVAWLQDYEDGRFLPRQRLVLHQGSQWRSENRQQADPRPTHAGGDEDGGQG
jgi:small-conductance mechanosensitive channel